MAPVRERETDPGTLSDKSRKLINHHLIVVLLIALLPPATKLGQGYVFTAVCDSVNRGGGGTSCPPRADTPHPHPPIAEPPPPEQTPLGAEALPQSRPPRSRHPPEQTPPGADTPLGADPPPKQNHPPPRSRHPLPPPTRRAWCEIRSTRGRYASYWNAILFKISSRCKQASACITHCLLY